VKPKIDIINKDFMQFFKCLTVSKYNEDEKNNSKVEFVSFTFFSVISEPLLNVINTVNNVKIKPELVRLIFVISEAIAVYLSSNGIKIMPKKQSLEIIKTIIIEIK
jgi:hypothetical protein